MFDNNPFDFKGDGNLDPSERAFHDEFLISGFDDDENDEYETMFHWQSQSTTSDTSPTGQRYIQHRKQGSKVLLCVREYKKDPWGNAAPYNVLGFVDYLQHTGSNPMNILWLLEEEIPAKYMKQTRKLLAG